MRFKLEQSFLTIQVKVACLADSPEMHQKQERAAVTIKQWRKEIVMAKNDVTANLSTV